MEFPYADPSAQAMDPGVDRPSLDSQSRSWALVRRVPLVSLCDALRATGLPARGRDARPEKLDRTSARGTCGNLLGGRRGVSDPGQSLAPAGAAGSGRGPGLVGFSKDSRWAITCSWWNTPGGCSARAKP